MRSGIVSAGTWCVDLNKTIDAWPAEDTASRIAAFEREGGGSGHNLATALKRLDPALPVEAMGLVGDDDDGRFLQGICDRLGIARDGLKASAAGPTFFTDCFNAKASGKRTHLYHPGIGDLMAPSDFDFAATRARRLHLGLPGVHATMDRACEGEVNGWAATLKAARRAGLATDLELVSIAADRLAALALPCLPHLDLLVVNDFEIGALAGVETRRDGVADPAGVTAALRAIMSTGPMALAIAHFPEGAIALSRDGAVHRVGSVAMPRAAIAGVNGAGDCFAAGAIYGLHEGFEVERCLALGHAAAAASMREAPTTTGVMPWRECLAMAERWGWR
ncbi:MAG: carbohydrate kinase family protein [Hyphomicrobiales bacterium]|nr:carbohydrate kinase family protein [Hyphomicrobiales bacterium]MDE2016685.1 carbohydrate kinase family protein [Hyphomicrobiales bacterium]